MGVHGLWELLAPVGRRVSVETLSGKRLAIDASIWMVQFMKAMRDENGEMVRNAHLLGFFRRICKLLFLRTKPVFVFDGATPALKRRTVLARRRQRENAQTKIRKTAERLLLNHLKEVNLKRLAEDLKNQKQTDGGKGKGVLVDKVENDAGNVKGSNFTSASYDQEKLDEMLAASLAVDDDGIFQANGSTSAAGVSLDEENNEDDEMEELILPTIQGDVDPNVLSSLPPSMQLDLLAQMRERLMAENRQKYQKVKKAPEKFSALQIQSYLKTVAFRREIDQVQKNAGNRGVGGVQTKKIASETSREFIFSSSFTGNRKALTSSEVDTIVSDKEKVSSNPHSSPSLVSDKLTQPTSGSDGGMNQSGEFSHENVETYLDERGRVHVSRVRALGLRMTRDLQRNLDMMKEMEKEKSNVEAAGKIDSGSSCQNLSTGSSLPNTSQMNPNSDIELVIDPSLDSIGQSTPAEKKSFQISFNDGLGDNFHDEDDEIFRSLVVGKAPVIIEVDNVSVSKPFNASDDIEWEEGTIEENLDGNHVNETHMLCEPSPNEGMIDDESGIEWEDGVSDKTQETAFHVEAHGHPNAASRGVMEEESQLQEAIKRSLQDAQAARVENESLTTVDSFSVDEGAQISPHRSDIPECSLLKQEVNNVISFSCESGAVRSQDIASEKSAVPNAAENLSATLEDQILNYIDDQTPVDDDQVNELCDVEVYQNHDDISSSKTSTATENMDGHLGANLVDSTPGSVKAAPKFFQSVDDSSTPSGNLPVQEIKNSDAPDFDVIFLEEEEPELDDSKRETLSRSGILELNMAQREDLEASLVDELSILNTERLDLGNEQKKLERNAEAVSGEMFAECQELLQMFGLPYIIAPMEAEAQCAFLELAGLVDGVVTDDSDVFLFGAQSVYKNIFDNKKYVETYFMKDIESELGLSREKLIRIAMLLGSDYTEGVSGIGIVNAVEVLNAFPEEDGFHKFREWIESPDPTIFYKKKGTPVKKKGSTPVKNGRPQTKQGLEKHGERDALDADESGHIDDTHELKQIFMDKHRNVSKNWHIPSSFPSDAVISAYISPKVDLSMEPFSHGRPDHPVLRKFCLERFGWGYQKTDELLLPVLKEYNKRETQLRLEAFYTFNEKFAKIRSKRMKKAVKGITGKKSLDDSGKIDSESNNSDNSRDPEEPVRANSSMQIGSMGDEVSAPVGKSQKKVSRKRKDTKEFTFTEKLKVQSPLRAKDKPNVGKPLSGTESSIQRDSPSNQLNRIQSKLSDSADISVGDASRQRKPTGIHETPQKLRRSTRNWKAVKYTSDVEVDYMDISSENVEASCAESEQGNPPSALSPLDPSQACTDHTGAPSAIDTSGDYLTMGGGFCEEEEEEVADES